MSPEIKQIIKEVALLQAEGLAVLVWYRIRCLRHHEKEFGVERVHLRELNKAKTAKEFAFLEGEFLANCAGRGLAVTREELPSEITRRDMTNE